jgi:hypothetical protein
VPLGALASIVDQGLLIRSDLGCQIRLLTASSNQLADGETSCVCGSETGESLQYTTVERNTPCDSINDSNV